MKLIRWGGFLAVLALAQPARAEKNAEPTYDRGAMKQFMHQKLASMQKVNEGMALDDFGMVADGLKSLDKLSKDATWRMIRTEGYQRYSRMFQDAIEDLAEKAKAKDANAAALAYLRLSAGCLECHAAVRKAVAP